MLLPKEAWVNRADFVAREDRRHKSNWSSLP